MIDAICMAREPNSTSKRPRKPTQIRAWRKYRGYSLEQVVDRLGTLAEFDFSVGQLSRVERGDYGYTQDLLEALSIVLNSTPQDLVGRDPLEGEASPRDDVDPELLEQALMFVKMARNKA